MRAWITRSSCNTATPPPVLSPPPAVASSRQLAHVFVSLAKLVILSRGRDILSGDFKFYSPGTGRLDRDAFLRVTKTIDVAFSSFKVYPTDFTVRGERASRPRMLGFHSCLCSCRRGRIDTSMTGMGSRDRRDGIGFRFSSCRCFGELLFLKSQEHALQHLQMARGLTPSHPGASKAFAAGKTRVDAHQLHAHGGQRDAAFSASHGTDHPCDSTATRLLAACAVLRGRV